LLYFNHLQSRKKKPTFLLAIKLLKKFLETDNPSLNRFNSVCQRIAKHLPLNSVPTASNKNYTTFTWSAMYL